MTFSFNIYFCIATAPLPKREENKRKGEGRETPRHFPPPLTSSRRLIIHVLHEEKKKKKLGGRKGGREEKGDAAPPARSFLIRLLAVLRPRTLTLAARKKGKKGERTCRKRKKKKEEGDGQRHALGRPFLRSSAQVAGKGGEGRREREGGAIPICSASPALPPQRATPKGGQRKKKRGGRERVQGSPFIQYIISSLSAPDGHPRAPNAGGKKKNSKEREGRKKSEQSA